MDAASSFDPSAIAECGVTLPLGLLPRFRDTFFHLQLNRIYSWKERAGIGNSSSDGGKKTHMVCTKCCLQKCT
jgi:hypothetical protein